MNSKQTAYLILAGGGTGGHVLAGISVADAWKAYGGKEASVLFIGARGGMEESLVPKSGYALKLLSVGSLNRVSIQKKIKTLFQLPFSFVKSIRILMTIKPQFILGVGGYASGPVLLIAKVLKSIGLLKVKIAILEQNAVPGFTNRILLYFADIVFVAFPGLESQFPHPFIQVTGNPIRSSIKRMEPALRDPFTIFIFGGSQGAIGVNSLVLEALPFLEDLTKKIRWIHQTGVKDYQRVLKGYEKQGITAQVDAFIDNMAAAYQKASLLICRSGSSTLSEIAAVGRAAIFIPLPTSSNNHQEQNARIFTDQGAAALLLQTGAKGSDLAQKIRELIHEPQKLSEMEKNVTQFFRPKAAEDIVSGLLNSNTMRPTRL